MNYYHNISIEDVLLTFENEHRNFMDSLYFEIEEQNNIIFNDKKLFNFRQGTPVLVLGTYLSKCIVNYEYDDDISKYFDLTHSPNNLVLVENNNGSIIAFIKQMPMGAVIYTNDSDDINRQYFRRLSKLLKKALNDNPDAIIINSSLGLLHPNKSPFVITIKNSHMYIYKRNKRKPIELNEFVKSNFDVESIRHLSKWSDVFSNPDYIIIR